MLIMKTKLIFPLKFYVDLNKTFILSQLKTFRLLEKNIYCLCVYMPEIFYRFSLSFNRRNYLLEGLFEKNKNQEVVYKQMWGFFLIFSYYFGTVFIASSWYNEATLRGDGFYEAENHHKTDCSCGFDGGADHCWFLLPH